MKTTKYLILIIFALSIISCEKNKDLLFAEDQKGLNIWLGSAGSPVDSVTYNYSYVLEGRDSILFYYRLLGFPTSKDLNFELMAYAGDTTQIDYEFTKYSIPTGQYEGSFPIYINKPKNFNHFTENPGKIKFKLKETDELKTGSKELSSLIITLQNKITKPDNWDEAPLYYLPLSRYFGTYSATKYSFIIQTIGKANFRVYSSLNAVTSLDLNAVSTGQAGAYQQLCKKALQQYNEQNPLAPLKDEIGNLVVFP